MTNRRNTTETTETTTIYSMAEVADALAAKFPEDFNDEQEVTHLYVTPYSGGCLTLKVTAKKVEVTEEFTAGEAN